MKGHCNRVRYSKQARPSFTMLCNLAFCVTFNMFNIDTNPEDRFLCIEMMFLLEYISLLFFNIHVYA